MLLCLTCGWSSGVISGADTCVSGVDDDPLDRPGDWILKGSGFRGMVSCLCC